MDGPMSKAAVESTSMLEKFTHSDCVLGNKCIEDETNLVILILWAEKGVTVLIT